jgi:hypothetical protein
VGVVEGHSRWHGGYPSLLWPAPHQLWHC